MLVAHLPFANRRTVFKSQDKTLPLRLGRQYAMDSIFRYTSLTSHQCGEPDGPKAETGRIALVAVVQYRLRPDVIAICADREGYYTPNITIACLPFFLLFI